MNLLTVLTIGDLADPIKNFLNNLKDQLLDVGNPLILLIGLVMCIIFIAIGIVSLKKSPKVAFGSWGLAALAIVVSIAWIVIKNVFTEVGEGAKDEDWTSAIQFLALIPTALVAYKYKSKKEK